MGGFACPRFHVCFGRTASFGLCRCQEGSGCVKMHPRLERGDVGSRGGCSHGAGDGNVALPPRHRLSRAELSAQVNVVQAGQGCPWVPSGSRSGREAKAFFREKKEGEKLKSSCGKRGAKKHLS